MPQGKGTYGSQVGRPRKRIIKSTVKRGNKRNDLKIKTKLNKDGSVKKTVTRFRGKRTVVKPRKRKNIVKSTHRSTTFKGGKIKVKRKLNKDGSLKKIVQREGGKRLVIKPKRDKKKTILNTLRNRRLKQVRKNF